jgi:uncharacterized protein with von Willebrand factor type A (vWA) domain
VLDDSFLLQIFYDLRAAGVRLDIDHLKLMIRAIDAGFGRNEESFARLCHILWLGTPQDIRAFDLAYERLLETTRGVDQVVKGLVVSRGEAAARTAQQAADQPADIVAGTHLISRDAKALRDRMVVAVTADEVEAIATVAIEVSGRDYLPISRRQIKQSLRYMRRMERSGPPVEIDVQATLAQFARDDQFAEPVVIPRRINLAETILFVDIDGSMVPFSGLERRLVTCLSEAGLARKPKVYYFHDCPEDFLFGDPGRGSSVDLAEALKTSLTRSFAIIVSDAGAARGRRDVERVDATALFLTRLRRSIPRVVWLNPVPQE